MSTWARDEDRLLLLELVAQGAVVARRSQEAALRHLAELGWVQRTRRAAGWSLAPEARGHLEAMLDREWPVWREVRARLHAAGLPPTFHGWSELRDAERLERLGTLPALLHDKTWAAVSGAHSKVGEARRRRPDTTRLTSDQVLRLRPTAGLTLVHATGELDATRVAQLNGGEVVLTQRALLDGTRLGGQAPRAILFIENLGAYLDLAVPAGVLPVHVPGWDSALVRLLIDAHAQTPLLQFGDLDPAGVKMFEHLRALFPTLRRWVPSFAPEYVEAHARPCAWPDVVPDALPAPLRLLVERGCWLEQEAIVLDPRCAAELEALVADAR